MKIKFNKIDLIYIIIILIVGIIISMPILGDYNSFLGISGDFLLGAFRLDSLYQNGLISYDVSWYGGITYWRSYQFILFYLLLPLKYLGLSSIQILYGFAIFYIFALRLIIYIILRKFKVNPNYSLIISIISYTPFYFWSVLHMPTLLFAILLTPIVAYYFINNTNFGFNKNTMGLSLFAGLSLYIHPLFGIYNSVILGFFWLKELFQFKIKTVLISGLIFILSSFLYIYQYFWEDLKFTDNYHLSSISYPVIRSFFHLDLLMVLIILFCIFLIWKNKFHSKEAKIFFGANFFMWLILLINSLYYIPIFHRVQITRMNQIVYIGILISGFPVYIYLQKKLKQRNLVTIMAFLSIILFSLVVSVVKVYYLEYTKTKENIEYYRNALPSIKSRVYDFSSDFRFTHLNSNKNSNYDFQFITGYSNHLVLSPNAGAFEDLIHFHKCIDGQKRDFSSENLWTYMKVLGVKQIFPIQEPYPILLQELIKQEKLKVINFSSDGNVYNILESNFEPKIATGIDESDFSTIQNLDTKLNIENNFYNYDNLDKDNKEIVEILFESNKPEFSVIYPKLNQILIKDDGKDIDQYPYIYLNHNYSKGFNINGSNYIQKSSDYKIIINRTGEDVLLTHQWHKIFYVQLFSWIFIIILIVNFKNLTKILLTHKR